MKKDKKPNRFLAFIRQIFTPAEALCILAVFISVQLGLIAYVYWGEHDPGSVWSGLKNINDYKYKSKNQREGKKLVLRVAAPQGERVLSHLSPYGPGFEQELLGTFVKQYKLEVEYKPAASRSEALQMLRDDEVDLVLGFAGDLTYEDGEELTAGHPYVTIPSGKVVDTEDSNSTWYTRAAKPQLPLVKHAEKNRESQFESDAGSRLLQGPFVDEDSGLLDEHSFKLWQPFKPDLKVSFKGSSPTNYRWVWRYDDVDFFPLLYRFWDDLGKDNHIQELEEKYFGFLPSGSPPWNSLQDLAKIVHSNVPGYKKTLSDASNRHNVSPLLLVALIYQESRFDPEAQSPTGPLGLMQFTQDTARRLNVDPLDPVKSIDAGAKYLKILWDDLADLNLDHWNRWFFTLASYNQGPAHLRDAVRLSQQMGGSGKTWRELKKVYPLLSQEKYYSQTKYGYCRGTEAVAFVEKIRYYFYVLNGMSSISRFEGQDLAANGSVKPEL